MKKKRIAIWVLLGIVVISILLWQTGVANYFLAKTVFAPDFEEDHLQEENMDTEEIRSMVDVEYEIEVIAENLEIPWEIVHLPDNRILVTERPGRVRIVDEGEIATIHSVEHAGEGGLLGMALHPSFEESPYIYLYYTYREGGDFLNRVSRYPFEENELGEEEVIIQGIPGGRIHNGGRIKFGPDDLLYITTGDAGDGPLAQNVNSLAGKILRLLPDGGIPESNPFEGSPVFAYGIRNPQGLAWHPATGELYSSGHGPSERDVINHIIAGGNYGWPEITCNEENEDFESAEICYTEFTLAPSGIDFYFHEALGEAPLYVAGLRGNMVMRIDFTREGDFLRQEALFRDYGRVRTVVYQDGSIYIATNNRDGRGVPSTNDDRILKITPKFQ